MEVTFSKGYWNLRIAVRGSIFVPLWESQPCLDGFGGDIESFALKKILIRADGFFTSAAPLIRLSNLICEEHRSRVGGKVREKTLCGLYGEL